MIYLDNAATSFPKPGTVLGNIAAIYSKIGCSPGRGSYDLAVEALEYAEEARAKVARLFGAPDPSRVVFTANATDALNLAIRGMVRTGDHVVSTRLEHNSVLRPLYHLKQQGVIDYDLVPFDQAGFVDPDDVAGAIRPETRLVVINHASNVLGTIQPIGEIGRICQNRGIPMLTDTAQSAGLTDMDELDWRLSAAAFTGHKALLGPTGIGGLVLSPDIEIEPWRVGGTGVDSANPAQPREYPHRLEAGTINLFGIIGLSLGLDYIMKKGVEEIREREMALIQRLYDGLADIDGVTLYGSRPGFNHVPLLVCSIDGKDPEDVGAILDADFGIAVRTGLHCAPIVAADLSAAERGTVRFSLGYSNKQSDIDAVLAAIAAIADLGG